MTAASGADPLGTIPLFDVKIPLTPARAAAIRRALSALDAVPAHRRELDLREHARLLRSDSNPVSRAGRPNRSRKELPMLPSGRLMAR